MVEGMIDPYRILQSLRRLNDLQSEPSSPWVRELSPGERQIAVEEARRGIPISILGHHDRRLARGKRSLAAVRHGFCGGCHLRLPGGHRRPPGDTPVLDVCDQCGIFLYWETAELLPVPTCRAVRKAAA